ncbi:MAG: hypothetical protein KatS3mg024_0323 [Armatimonadota bacterium]|nr:MAG: hypothetical protein KatS3mg024_0323 [Armatimonadota bacterium]
MTMRVWLVIPAAALLTAALTVAALAAVQNAPSIDVRSLGAVGDGTADDTDAFEKAIDLGRKSGRPVHVPRGRYRITRTLELKAQELTGADHAAWVADGVTLPTILPDVPDGPAIRLLGGGSVHGLYFFQDWKGGQPSERPAIIELAGVGTRVSEVKIQNAWNGISADGKSNVGRALIRDCFLVDIHNVGIRMLGTWDVSWISRVEIWSPASKRFLAQGIGFLIGKNDMLLMSDCFVFSGDRGYKFVESVPGSSIRGVMWGSMTNCSADFCGIGIEVEGAHTLSLAGGTYWTHHSGILIHGKGAQVRMSGLEMKSNSGPCIDIQGGSLVAVAGCQLRREMARFVAPALRISGGETVAISGCVLSSTSTAIEVAEGLTGVVLSGNATRENVPEPPEEPNVAP